MITDAYQKYFYVGMFSFPAVKYHSLPPELTNIYNIYIYQITEMALNRDNIAASDWVKLVKRDGPYRCHGVVPAG